jgi:hypothetical protein
MDRGTETLPTLTDALTRLDAFVERLVAETGTPGLAMARTCGCT